MRALLCSLLVAALLASGCTSKNSFVTPSNTVKAPDSSQIVDNTPKLPSGTPPGK